MRIAPIGRSGAIYDASAAEQTFPGGMVDNLGWGGGIFPEMKKWAPQRASAIPTICVDFGILTGIAIGLQQDEHFKEYQEI